MTASNKKILITGANGFVGARAAAYFENAAIVPSELTRVPDGRLADFVKTVAPDIIINAAAISDIPTCEKDPDASYMANVSLPLVLARVAEELSVKLLSFSSDQVYTGCTSSGPYRESESLPTPANVYARHKLEAEQRVLDACPSAVLLRATWMYDMPLYDHANRGNFIVNILTAAARSQKIAFSSKQYRGVTYVRQAVERLPLAATLPGGVYNYGSENSLSMYETAKYCLSSLGLARRIPELLRDNFSTNKGHDLWMDCSLTLGYGLSFDTAAEGIDRCINDYRLNG